VEDEDDPAVVVVQRLQQRYPSVVCRLYMGGKQGVINPMVYNMAPAYDSASYDIVWVSTSRIKGSHFSSHHLQFTATVGPGETFSRGPKTFLRAPLGRKILNFSFQNGSF